MRTIRLIGIPFRLALFVPVVFFCLIATFFTVVWQPSDMPAIRDLWQQAWRWLLEGK